MNIKNLLIITLMFVNTASAMKRKGESHRCESYEKRNELISFTSLHGFPLISLDSGQKWAARLSEKELQKIRKQIKWQKDERFTALLRMVGLPSETKRLIVAHIFEDYKKVTNISHPQVFAEYKNAADMFCRVPLCDALNQYYLSTQIFQNPEKYSIKPNPFPLHLIFEYAPDIKVNHEIKWRQSNICCSKKELEILERVHEKFGEFVKQHRYLRYQLHNKITCDRIKQSYKDCFIDQTLLFFSVAALYMAYLFPLESDCLPDQARVGYNIAANELNQAIRTFHCRVASLSKETGWYFLDYISYVKKYNDDYCSDYVKGLRVALGLIGIFPACTLLFRSDEKMKATFTNEETMKAAIKKCIPTLIGMYGVWKVMSYIALQTQESPWCGVGWVMSLYMLLCSCYNVHKVKSLQEGTVMFKDIQQLLQRTDIEIV
jgi:hypothetical protein